MLTLHARHYAAGRPVAVTCEHRLIQSIVAAPEGELPWIAPAFFDLQINGCDGHSFNSPTLTADQVRHVVHVCRRHGIGELLPTLVTGPFPALAHGMATIRQARAADPEVARAIPGIHLEGPYISPEDGARGAHPLKHVRPPDGDEFQRLQEAAGGLIRLVTLAPETEGALPFITNLTKQGIVVAIGHTAASPAVIREAVKAGAKLSTHLGNGSHAMLPRHENYFFEQLASDKLWASIICDGHHLPSSLVKCILRVKTPARLILTCDASSLAGLPAGRYSEWDFELDVLEEGKVVVPGTPFLAGSWAFTDLCVGNAIEHGGVTLAQAVDMAGANPRELLGLPPRRLQVGDPADLVLFTWRPGEQVKCTQLILTGVQAPG